MPPRWRSKAPLTGVRVDNKDYGFRVAFWPSFGWCLRLALARLFRPAYVGKEISITVYDDGWKAEGFDGVDYLAMPSNEPRERPSESGA